MKFIHAIMCFFGWHKTYQTKIRQGYGGDDFLVCCERCSYSYEYNDNPWQGWYP